MVVFDEYESQREIMIARRQQESVKKVECEGQLSVIDLLLLLLILLLLLVPARNCYRAISELSCGNELFYTLMEGSRRLKPLQGDILQGGQHFCRPSPDQFLQSGR